MNPFVPKINPGTLKDFFNNEVKDGDILLAITTEEKAFWGLVVKKESGWNNRFEGPNPHLGSYSLLHGWGVFPSSLAWAKKFMIIDNCLSNDIKRPLIGDYERCYELWTEQNRDRDFSKEIEYLINS